jgi:putative phosphoribosyl transferase
VSGDSTGGPQRTVAIDTNGARLVGDLAVPEGAVGLVVFAHGSGSGRHSPRNRAVAAGLRHAGVATLLMDLLTESEERIDQRTGELRFDIPLLARRLTGAVDWLADRPDAAEHPAALPVGLFGASTGAAAALITAADRQDRVRAVVSRGGRPDLADAVLGRVAAPVLLVVGGADPTVARLNEQAARQLRHARLYTVPGATHLFEEPGALDEVTRVAADWFRRWLPGG